MPTEVASLITRLTADSSGLEKGLRDADQQVGNFASKASRSVGNFGKTLAGLGAATLPLTAALGGGIKVASDFESAMTEISARTGIMGQELQNLSDFALQMGADTVFSGQQAADALLQILTSGSSAAEAMALLPLVLDAAAASGESLGGTADTITDIIAAFNLDPIDEAVQVVDALSQAAGASSATMGQLGEGFANVGGVASQFGLSVEDTAAALAIFSENGTKGAEAGTQLKSMLLNMSQQTDKNTAAWNELGTSMYDAAGAARPLEDVIREMDTALDTMSAEDQNRIMMELGGSYGIVGLQALRGSMSIEEMREKMRASAKAGDVADAKMDTFAMTMDSLTGSVEALMITALTPLMNDVLKPLAKAAIEVVSEITDWVRVNPQLASTIARVAFGISAAGTAALALGGALMIASPIIAALGVGLALIVSPIGLVAAGLIAAAAAVSRFGPDVATAIAQVDFGGLAQKVQDGVAGIQIGDTTVGAIATDIKTKIETAINGITIDTSSISNLPTAITDAVSGITIDTTALSVIPNQIGEAIRTSFVGGINLTGVSTWAKTNMNTILDTVVTVAGIVFGGPIGLAIGAAKLISSAIENDFLGIGTFLGESGIGAAVETAFNDLKATIDGIIASIFGGGGEQSVSMSDHVRSMVDTGGGAGVLGKFGADLAKGVGVIKGIVESVGPGITEGIEALGAGVGRFIAGITGAETEGLYDAFRPVLAVIGGLVSAGITLAGLGIGTILETIGNVLGPFGEGIGSLITAVSNLGEGDVGGALSALGTGIKSFGDAALAIPATIANNVLSAIEDLTGVELPDFPMTIDAWTTEVERVFSDLGRRITVGFEDVIRGIQIKFAELLVTAGQLGTLAGVTDTGEATAALQSLGSLYSVDKIVDTLESQMGAGVVDLSENITFALPGGATFTDTIANIIANGDPSLLGEEMRWQLEDAFTVAVAGGDFATAGQILAVAPRLDLDIDEADAQAQIVTQLVSAVQTGDQSLYTAALGMAVTLGLDPISIQEQVRAQVEAAAAGATPTANVGVTVNPTVANIPGIVGSVMAQIQGALAGTGIGQGLGAVGNALGGIIQTATGAGPIPQYASGASNINQDGLAYLHKGEAVLNADQNRDRMRGGGGKSSGNTYVMNYYGQTPYDVLEMTRRAASRGDKRR